jgi:hypothetical protein
MKKLLLLCLIAGSAQAAIMGTLVSSRSGASATGHLVWECTYRVLGGEQSIVLDHMCPQTMMFN